MRNAVSHHASGPGASQGAGTRRSRQGPSGNDRSDQQRLQAAMQDSFRLVWRTLRGLGVHAARVDDATQSAFLTLAARLREVEPGRERGFLVQTAVRVAANVRRSQARERETATEKLDDLGVELRDPERLLAAKQRRGLLDRILEMLSPELRVVFTLFELEGFTAAEIAALLEIPPGTVFLSAPWALPFYEPPTEEDGIFTLASGEQIMVPMMRSEAEYPYVADDSWTTAELFYADSRVSMVLVLPPEGEFEAFEASFDSALLSDVLDALAHPVDAGPDVGMVNIHMPKFSFDSSVDLEPPLKELGIVDAFSLDQADFSGMDAERELAIDRAMHKTHIAIDEKGTEAAAGTGAGMVYSGIVPAFYLVRPFVSFIHDRDTGTVLFVGRLANPAAT